MFVASLLLTAALTSAVPFDHEEPTCVINELDSLVQSGVAYKLVDAVQACQSRYHWTDQDVQASLQVTRALFVLRNNRTEAETLGVDIGVVDQIFDRMSDEDRLAFGWEGNPQPIPKQLSSAVNEFPASFTTEQKMKGGLIVVFSAVAHNAIDAFIRQRMGQRD